MRRFRATAAALIAAVLLLPLSARAAWSREPTPALSAALSADGATVTLTLSLSASDPLCALQAEIAYDHTQLTAEGNPRLLSPWSSMLAASNVREPGLAALAAASAVGVENPGGAAAVLTFSVSPEAAGPVWFCVRSILIGSADGSRYERSDVCYLTLALTPASGGGGGGGVGGGVIDPAPPAAETSADPLSAAVLLQDGNYAAVVRGELAHIDAENRAVTPYVNKDGRTMVPVRFVAEALGAKVGWDPALREVSIAFNGHDIRLRVGSTAYTVDGAAREMDTVSVINAGLDRTMVPIRFVAEALTLSVEWDTAHRMVIITPAAAPWNLAGEAEQAALSTALYLMSSPIRDFL